ncbi:Protein of unknown function [Pyronema omphalodes CBS 100304]|uniref:Uncharacterized protein n=1 Tax=Pyronema omphalodes (strain CBS 100304) TaxID=1076935 RepID=U4LWC0_PYROM|nr:Protein of unknown function [Pyronema omphalodes CBS 100304]
MTITTVPSKSWTSDPTAPLPTQTSTAETPTNSTPATTSDKPAFASQFKMFDLEVPKTPNEAVTSPSEEHICRYAKQMSLTMNGAGMTKQMRARLLAKMIREEHLRGLARDAVR